MLLRIDQFSISTLKLQWVLIYLLQCLKFVCDIRKLLGFFLNKLNWSNIKKMIRYNHFHSFWIRNTMNKKSISIQYIHENK